MNVDLHNEIMAEKLKSRAHLFYMSAPEKDDHRPSMACTGMKSPREDKHSRCQRHKGDNTVIRMGRLSHNI